MNIPKWLNKKIDKSGIQEIENAIKVAEQNTNAEIVPMIVKESSYSFKIELVALLTLVLAIVSFMQLHTTLISVFVFTLIYFKIKELKKKMIHQRGLIEFYQSSINKTKDNTGVLLFISLKEKQIEVIVDKKINLFVDSNTWNTLVDEMIFDIKDKSLSVSISNGIKSLGEILADICPKEENNTNEIPNQLIIKE